MAIAETAKKQCRNLKKKKRMQKYGGIQTGIAILSYFCIISYLTLASPTAPRQLRVVDITSTSVTVKWQEPLSNGGIPLTGYVIEKYDVTEKKWVTVGVADPSDTSYHVANLTTSHEYFFRIKAETLAGISPLVESSESVMLNRSKGKTPIPSFGRGRITYIYAISV